MVNVTIPVLKYQEMVMKVMRYDAIRNMIKNEIKKGNRYPVKDEIVLTILDLIEYKTAMEKKTAEALKNE